jgi:hypothetical protein
MTARSMILKKMADRIVDLTVTNDSPALSMIAAGDGRMHAFGVTDHPRFLMERPYSPDDAWLFSVDGDGGLASGLPSLPAPTDAELEAFLGRPLDHSTRALLHALPTGRYALVRSSRPLIYKAEILLGNELVPAPPNALVLGETNEHYAVAFGASHDLKPNATGLFVGVAVLAYNGQDDMDGMWLFDLSGTVGPAGAPGGIAMVLPLEGPLVIDALAGYRRGEASRAVKQRWANERGAVFVQWCAGG